jgi:hypothetical protein
VIPGYYTQKEVLAALGMSRQNFYQTGLAAVLRPAATIGRSQLYRAEDVGLWRDWLRFRKARIAMGEWPGDVPLLPEGADKWPSWIGDYEWDCPVCGDVAYAPDDPDDHRLYCPVDGWIEMKMKKYRLYNFESGEWENDRVLSAAEARKRIGDDMKDPDLAALWRDEVWGYLNIENPSDAIMASDH